MLANHHAIRHDAVEEGIKERGIPRANVGAQRGSLREMLLSLRDERLREIT